MKFEHRYNPVCKLEKYSPRSKVIGTSSFPSTEPSISARVVMIGWLSESKTRMTDLLDELEAGNNTSVT